MSSCSSIESEIAALRADIAALNAKYALKTDLNNYIPKADKPQIITDSVDRAYNLILPESKGYTDNKFNILDFAIAALKLLFYGFKEEMEARQRAIQSALETINSLVQQLKQLLALPARVQKLEQDILRINPELARLLGLIKIAQSTADTALSNSQRALEIAIEARYIANKATADIRALEGFTKLALQRIETYIKSEIKKLDNRIDGVIKTVDQQSIRIGQIIQRLLRLEALSAGFQSQIDALISQVNSFRQKINIVEKAVANIYGLLFQALQQIDVLDFKLDESIRRIDEAISKANQAIRKADDAIGKANIAENLARSIKGELESRIKNLQAYLEGTINTLSSEIFGLNLVASTALSVAQNSLSTSQSALAKGNQLQQTKQDKGGSPLNDLDKRFNDFVSANNKALNIKDLQTSNLSKEFDKKLSDFQRLSGLGANQRFNDFVAANNKALNIKDLQTSNLSKEFDQRLKDFDRLSKLDAEARFAEFSRSNEQSLGGLKLKDNEYEGRLSRLETPKTNPEIEQLKRRLGEQERVNKEGLDKLNQILPVIGTIPLIPGRVADGLRPSIPTINQIGAEVGKVNCRSLQSGCGRKAIDNQTNAINNAANANKGDLLNKINAGANAGQLALLTKIDGKLGAQIPGGIGGKLVAGFKWLQLDRALNILTFAATVHNAAMLSNDIFQTLVGVLTNVLTLILPKDDAGNAFNIGEAIGNTVENVVKGIVGEANYTNLTAGWAKANRIYQATTNVLNSFMNISQVILQASEMIAAYTGKIGNALKKGGVVLENAYGWMNPQPKFNRVTQTLEAFQQTASTVQMVTQVPLDFVNATTESINSATEFTKAIKEDDKPVNKAVAQPEPDELKAKETAAKTVSQPNPFDFSDLFDGEDL